MTPGDDGEAFDEAMLQEIPLITPQLLSELLGVEPSRDADVEYRPCRVHLRDDRILDFVLLVEAGQYIRSWGIWPELDRDKRSTSLSQKSSGSRKALSDFRSISRTRCTKLASPAWEDATSHSFCEVGGSWCIPRGMSWISWSIRPVLLLRTSSTCILTAG